MVAARADITSTEQVDAAAKAAKDAFGTVHIVVNNAGGPDAAHGSADPLAGQRLDRRSRQQDPRRAASHARVPPLMPGDGTGRIINISGTASTIVWAPALTHGLNNAAMNQATGYLATDLASQQITVNTVVPGLVGTEGP